jgi:hypothetical protein
MRKSVSWRGYRREFPPLGARTFNDWLKRAIATKDPPGDFIKDARTDDTMPAIRTQAELRNHLVFKHRACPEALATIPEVWARFQKWRNKNLKT